MGAHTPSPSESHQLSPSQSEPDSPFTHQDTIPAAHQLQSPRVTVSMWGRDEDVRHDPARAHDDLQSAGDPISPTDLCPLTSQAFYAPSIDELAARREVNERNELVRGWLSDRFNELSVLPERTGSDDIQIWDRPRHDTDAVPFGKQTQNSCKPEQLYFNGTKETLGHKDYDLIASSRNWGNAPILHPIDEGTRHEPETSAAAMERYHRMTCDTDSIVSRAATCGTRRLSLHDPQMTEGGTVVGNILRKFLGTKEGSRPGGLLKDLRGLVRRPTASQILKRNRTVNDDEETEGAERPKSKRGLEPRLQPPTPVSSWGKKPMPSTNMAPDTATIISPTGGWGKDTAAIISRTAGWGTKPFPSMNTSSFLAENKPASIGAAQSEAESTNHTSAQSPKSAFNASTTFTPGTSPSSEFSSLAAKDILCGLQLVRKKEPPAFPSWDPQPAPYYSATGSQFVHLPDLPLDDGAKPSPTKLEGQDTGYLRAEGGDDSKGSAETPTNYQPSDFSDLEDDPFFGVDFQNEGGTPTFLDELTPLSPGMGNTTSVGKGDDHQEDAKIHLGGSEHYLPTPEMTTSTAHNARCPVKDESRGRVLLQGSECDDKIITASEPKPQCGTPIQEPVKSKRQVGFARVKIDIISLSRSLPSGQSDHASSLSSEVESESEESLQEEQADSGDQERANSVPQIEPSGSSGASSLASAGANANQPDDNVDRDGANGDRNKRPCRKTPKPASKRNTPRFACPYQAFEASQNCFRPGPRNPNGGCTGIQRLKQHLSRRHMQSYRCNKCWRSFESRDKVDAHSKQTESCQAREMPATERFMHPDHEKSLERECCSKSAEETWWMIFKLLIPGMQDRSLESLKSQYWPYYIQLDSFMVPGIVFPNALFESEQPSVHAPDGSLEGSEYITQTIQNPYLNMDPPPLPNSTPASHTVYVPLLEASAGAPLQPGLQYLECSTASQSGASALTPNSGLQTSTQATSTLQASETATQASQSVSDQTQLRRNHERLRARYSRLEGEIDEIRDVNRTAGADLGRADAVIDGLLASENLPRHIEDRLSEVAQILESVRKKLR